MHDLKECCQFIIYNILVSVSIAESYNRYEVNMLVYANYYSIWVILKHYLVVTKYVILVYWDYILSAIGR